MIDDKEKIPFKKKRNKFSEKVRPKEWLGYNQIVDSAKFIRSEAKKMFFLDAPVVHQESYYDLIEKLGLTPETLEKKRRFFLGMTVFFLFLMLIVLGYTFYHGMAGHYKAVLPSFVLSILCLALAFRYHFWYFQLKVEKLGCTFQDWLDYVLSGKKP